MKITKIEEFITAVPHIPSIEKSRPGDYKERPISIIKVHTDEGIYGVGEGGRGGSNAELEAEWVGIDPLTVNLGDKGGAVIMALYDIVGKALGVPAWKLMGSKHWDKVPVGYWSPPLEPHEFAAAAENGARQGFKTHKLKARPWNIVETVELMTKAAGPDYGIIVDPNFTFEDLATSLRIAEKLEKYNIQAFEDPFRYLPGFQQYRDFRRHSRIPLAPHLYDSNQIMSAIRAEGASDFERLHTEGILQGQNVLREGKFWTPVEIDLSPWAGQRVTLRMELETPYWIEPGTLSWVGSPRLVRGREAP